MPLVRVRCACQGPSASRGSSVTVTGPAWPGARVAAAVTGNGPALADPGPSDRVREPVMSSARAPVLWTWAVTLGVPSGARSAVSSVISKLDAGSPPGPMSRYTRTPSRLAWITFAPPLDPTVVCAQMTAYRSPSDAVRGTAMVTRTVPMPPGAIVRLFWSRVIQLVSSLGVRPSAKVNVLFWMVAAAG